MIKMIKIENRKLELEKPKRKLIDCNCLGCGKGIGRFEESVKICCQCKKDLKQSGMKV